MSEIKTSSNVESILHSTSNDSKDNEYSSVIVGTYDGNIAYNDQNSK